MPCIALVTVTASSYCNAIVTSITSHALGSHVHVSHSWVTWSKILEFNLSSLRLTVEFNLSNLPQPLLPGPAASRTSDSQRPSPSLLQQQDPLLCKKLPAARRLPHLPVPGSRLRRQHSHGPLDGGHGSLPGLSLDADGEVWPTVASYGHNATVSRTCPTGPGCAPPWAASPSRPPTPSSSTWTRTRRGAPALLPLQPPSASHSWKLEARWVLPGADDVPRLPRRLLLLRQQHPPRPAPLRRHQLQHGPGAARACSSAAPQPPPQARQQHPCQQTLIPPGRRRNRRRSICACGPWWPPPTSKDSAASGFTFKLLRLLRAFPLSLRQ